MKAHFLCCCECNPELHLYFKAHHQHKCSHYLTDLKQLLRGYGPCLVHHGTCDVREELHNVDLMIGGPSCYPWAGSRDKGKGAVSGKQGLPKDHPDFEMTFSDYFDLTDMYHPKGGIVEQVDGFANENEECLIEFGYDSYCQMFCARLRSRGCLVRALMLSMATWSKVPRNRTPD